MAAPSTTQSQSPDGLQLSHIPTRQINDSDGLELDAIATVPTHEGVYDMDGGMRGKVKTKTKKISFGGDEEYGEEEKEEGEEEERLYTRFTNRRKAAITAMLCLSSFLGPMSTTAVLPAVPDIAKELDTTGTVINLSNGLLLLSCAFSPCIWSPLSEMYGKRISYLACNTFFLACSLGTALAPNLPAYFVFRLMTGLAGTGFLLLGASTIGDLYKPVERGTAMGWFLSGTVIGPGFGPVIGGIITQFSTWRVYFWLQSGLSGLSLVLMLLWLPETAHHLTKNDYDKQTSSRFPVLRRLNPLQPLLLILRHPNILATGIASSALIWHMYALLTPIRYTLNPRFNLDTPLSGALFFLAPGCGNLVGTFVGGRWADVVVRKWIKKRNGVRVPHDRLRSCLPTLAFVMPVCALVYGWTVETAKGGYPVPVLAMFVQGVGSLVCFGSLNTYCVDVMQARSSQAVGGNYIFRYSFGAAASMSALPIIEAIGVGWLSTVSAGFMMLSGGLVALTIYCGDDMMTWRLGKAKEVEAEDQIREKRECEVASMVRDKVG